MTDDFLQELTIDFYNESLELLERLEALLLEIEVPEQEQINEIFRIAHSIKGGAGTVGLDHVTN